MTTHAKTDEAAVQKAPPLSQNPGRAIQEMMNTIDTLRNIYIRETEALTKADTQTFLSMQDEKLNAARNYQERIQQLMMRKDEIRQADPKLHRRLQEMQGDFSKLAVKNAEALKRMDRCVERLGNTIRRAAKEEVQKRRAVNYDATGMMRHTENKSVSTGVSETA